MQAAAVQFYRLHAAIIQQQAMPTLGSENTMNASTWQKVICLQYTVHLVVARLNSWIGGFLVTSEPIEQRGGAATRVPTAASSFRWSGWAEPPLQTCRSSQRGAATGSTSSWKSASRPLPLARLHDRCLPSYAPRPSQWNQGSAWANKLTSQQAANWKGDLWCSITTITYIHRKLNVNTTKSCKGLNERIIPSPSLAQIGSS